MQSVSYHDEWSRALRDSNLMTWVGTNGAPEPVCRGCQREGMPTHFHVSNPSCLRLSVFTQYFLQMQSCMRKCKIHSARLFPSVSAEVEQNSHS